MSQNGTWELLSSEDTDSHWSNLEAVPTSTACVSRYQTREMGANKEQRVDGTILVLLSLLMRMVI